MADTLIAIAGLDMSPLPSRLRAALYHVSRALPGVRSKDTHDALGRPGVQVAGGGFALIFDPQTGALRSTTTGTFFDQGTAGTIVAQAPVPNALRDPPGPAPDPQRGGAAPNDHAHPRHRIARDKLHPPGQGSA